MRKLLFALTVVACLAAHTALAGPELRNDHPDRYTVVTGDTLWDISGRFLNEPWFWPEIWHVNPQIDNPHLIFPGDVLALIYIDGQPRLTKVASERVIRLSPQVRATAIDTPIPTIPLDAIESFLSETRIIDSDLLDSAPYVLEGTDRRIVSGAGDRVYARGNATRGENLSVFRRNVEYVDPETNEFLGLEARSIGRGRVSAAEGEVLTFQLTRTREEVRTEDRLLPAEDREITTSFQPSAPDKDIRGLMIAVEDGVSNIGQYDVVTVNRGEREGLRPGNVLAVYKEGGTVRDPVTDELVKLPSERAGLLMVFRTYEKLSYGLVLQASRPLALMDSVRNP
ncbi:MAG: LysM peptidoglycan-binding domain-containing protein [Halomonadaceae bacterium]|nr:MAG: LysM peptidoglycan-binding domain-containing protein [Halomonadaceae bacterium]